MENLKIIEFLKWDSEFFGIKIGKIQLTESIFQKTEFINEQNQEQYDLIYGFSSSDKTPFGFWESLGFYLADCTVSLSMKPDFAKYKNIAYEHCDSLSIEDVNSCYAISDMTARVSRFYRGPIIGKELTKKLYRKWVDSASDGSFCDHLFVERIESKIVGIHAIKTENNVGAVSLLGVKEGFHGRGIGRRLLGQSFSYWASNMSGVRLIQTKFSISNMPAFGFYIAMGFNTIESTNYIYHYSKRYENASK
ncbi:MAG: GNAT family N-acetyltransferase [Candidatus Omnitrophica bacterium]|nr:GNAT family N-acetyltransferase [Candidatus Omnitrophota bacterium]